MELLKKLSEAHGPSGREEQVRELVWNRLKPLVDEIRVDALGNLIGIRKAPRSVKSPRKIMIAAHMDEIGFMVSHLDKEGFLRITPVGGFDPKTLIAKRVLVHGEKKTLVGIIGSKPIHVMEDEEKKKMPQIKDLFIDLGLAAKQVEKWVAKGDPVTLQQDFCEIGECLSGKAMDDRVGVFAMLEGLRKARKTSVEIYAVATTQEEVGLRGAGVSAFGVAPDVGIALDVTLACDVPGIPAPDQVAKMGKGVSISIMNAAIISHPQLVRDMKELAQQRKIPHQLDLMPRGGTDAGAIQRSRAGVPAITLSIPTRYVHSVVEMVSRVDVHAASDLLAAYLENAHRYRY